MTDVLRWGIAGSGRISSDFCTALKIKPENHKVKAVGARKLEDAELFAKRFNISHAYGSYQELIDHPDIDIIYIGVYNPGHFDLCKLCLNNGKNVICEKPLTLSQKQTKYLVDLAREKKVFFMEGYWTRFFPAYSKMLSTIKEGGIGEVKTAVIEFGIDFKMTPAVNNLDRGRGAMPDIGCYAVQLACDLFHDKPVKISAHGGLTSAGVDLFNSIYLEYPNQRFAVLIIHGGVNFRNVAAIYGSEGNIEIPHFWNPDSLIINGKREEFPVPPSPGKMNFISSEGMIYEADHCKNCIKQGQTESSRMSLDDSITVCDIMEEIRNQVGVIYPPNATDL